MSSTIDNINTNIITKIQELKKIINVYVNYDFNNLDNSLVLQFKEQLDEVLLLYEFGSIDTIKQYYEALEKNNIAKSTKIYKKFINFITTENLMSIIKRIYINCKRIYKLYNISEEYLIDCFKLYDKLTLDIDSSNDTTVQCNCGSNYMVDPKKSERICINCGENEKLRGIVFEDEQFFYQEGQRTKHGKYDPTKHCKFWMDRIEAKEIIENEEFENMVNTIKSCIKHDKIWLEQVTCSTIRDYLKKKKLTKFNDHVPLTKKIITGKETVQLMENERKLVFIYFSKVVQIYNKIKDSNDSNCPYHPYFIYKIIDQILTKECDIKRKEEILNGIHLQSRSTLIKNDLKWKMICQYIPEFKYCPTNCK